MSKTIISLEKINSVEPHPNANRLDIVQVLGFQVVTQKGYSVGDLVVYFPPDILIPADVAESTKVINFLKHSIYPGQVVKTQCRVGAARIRGIPSYGFVCPPTKCGRAIEITSGIGSDLTDQLGGHKYIPPPRNDGGKSLPDLINFHRYTDIDNIQRYPDAFEDGSEVVITEKIHGTNCRLGLVRDKGEFIFCAGSHNQRRAPGGVYWEFMDEKMMGLLSDLCDEKHDVIVFGEIFGPGIQDLDYGQVRHAFRVFDISINGTYMNYHAMIRETSRFDILCVPKLFEGSYSGDIVKLCTVGRSEFKNIQNRFKNREGCVIRPIIETHSSILGGRLIAKSISADYRDRKGAIDVE